MAYTDQDDNGAIDTGDTHAPPTQPSAQPTSPGAIDTSGSDPNDNSGAAPVAATPPDNSGAPPVMPASPQQSASPGSVNSPSYGPLGPIADKIKKLLGGEGALSPQLLDSVAQKVDPEGKMTPADRQVAAIHAAYESQGSDAALAILQANRVAYGTKAAFARTALMGNGQKPADLNAAITAANQAQENLPDGSNIVFSHGGRNGVTATVTMPGSNKPVSFNLTPQQFGQFLDVGGDGQFDKLMDVSAPAMLQRLVSANAAQAPLTSAQVPFGVNQKQTTQPPAQAAPQKPYKWGENSPSALDLSGETSPRQPETDEQRGMRDAELEGKARRMFPWASQDQQKNQWMSQQEEEEAKRNNAVEVASEKGKRALEVAKATGTSRENVAQTNAGAKVQASENYSKAKVEAVRARLEEMAAEREAKNGRNKYSAAARAINAKIAANGVQSLNDEEKQLFHQVASQIKEPQAATPQAPAPKAATPAAAASQPSAKDQQAMAWAKANPNDPRAAQIMQRLNGAQ